MTIAIQHFPGKGRGVVALRVFRTGDMIERAPVIVISHEEAPLIRDTRLAHYYFEWGDDCRAAAIVLGYGSLYNHSYTASARYEFCYAEECIEFFTLRDIQASKEITINYNKRGESANKPLMVEVHQYSTYCALNLHCASG